MLNYCVKCCGLDGPTVQLVKYQSGVSNVVGLSGLVSSVKKKFQIVLDNIFNMIFFLFISYGSESFSFGRLVKSVITQFQTDFHYKQVRLLQPFTTGSTSRCYCVFVRI